jgi:hypothetical protein
MIRFGTSEAMRDVLFRTVRFRKIGTRVPLVCDLCWTAFVDVAWNMCMLLANFYVVWHMFMLLGEFLCCLAHVYVCLANFYVVRHIFMLFGIYYAAC